MRLGIVGIVPSDPRAIGKRHLELVRALGVTAACFHVPGELLLEITRDQLRDCQQRYVDFGLEIAQLGVGYEECLFDPDPTIRATVQKKIKLGLTFAAELKANVLLIRTGSLSSSGSYSPSPYNYESGRLETLIEELAIAAVAAEAAGVTIVLETHNLTILGSPEISRQVITAINSPRLRVVMDFVNHFQSLEQAYASTARINHIFNVMGPFAAIAHVKDIVIADGFVIHLNEAPPGEGCLDLLTAISLWESLLPDGYMLVEHLSDKSIPNAVKNVIRLAAKAEVNIW